MPRIIEERWMGIGFDVVTENVQKTDPTDGQPLYDGKGLPQTEEVTTLVLIHSTADTQTVVKIPFTAESKQELIRKLTGGIVVPNGNGGVPHLPFGKGT